MLQCFCEDCERNDGSAMHPYYMPNAFRKIILDATDTDMHSGSRMLGAMLQILKAARHTVIKAAEPIKLIYIRWVARWKDSQRQKEYSLMKQHSLLSQQSLQKQPSMP